MSLSCSYRVVRVDVNNGFSRPKSSRLSLALTAFPAVDEADGRRAKGETFRSGATAAAAAVATAAAAAAAAAAPAAPVVVVVVECAVVVIAGACESPRYEKGSDAAGGKTPLLPPLAAKVLKLPAAGSLCARRSANVAADWYWSRRTVWNCCIERVCFSLSPSQQKRVVK